MNTLHLGLDIGTGSDVTCDRWGVLSVFVQYGVSFVLAGNWFRRYFDSFATIYRPALELTESSGYWSSFPRGKRAGAWSWAFIL